MKVYWAFAASSLMLSGCQLFSQNTFEVPEPNLESGSRPNHFSGTSTVRMEVVVPLSEIASALDQKVPATFSGTEADPTNALTEDSIEWSMQRGAFKVDQGKSGELLFSVPITTASATLHGRLGIRRRNEGILGALEQAGVVTFRETANFQGIISGSLAPAFHENWTLDPHLKLDVRLNKAEARLFSESLKISIRQIVEAKIRPKAAELAADLNRKLRSDDRLRQAVGQGWQRLHNVASVSTDPQAWLVTSPLSIASSDPIVDHGTVKLRLDAAVRTALLLENARPAIPTATKLPLLNARPVGEPNFSLAVPVSIRLSEAKLPGNGKNEPFEVPLGNGSVKVTDLRLNGDNGRLIVSAYIDASHPTVNRAVRGRIYLVGRPELNAASMMISTKDLNYSLETRNVLARTANWILQPFLVNELRKRAVFSFADSRAEFLARANAQIGQARARLPEGLSTNLSVRELNLVGLVVDEGWLTALVTASGPAQFTFDGQAILTPRAR
jgi:hypothetical protein